MTRLFGCICNEPNRLAEALEPVRSVLTAPGPHHGWGIGYVQSGEVLLRRHPRPRDEPVDFYAALESVSSDYIIGQVNRDGTYAGTENTQPFRFRHWLYAQSGSVPGFADVRPKVVEHLPGFLERQIKGKTSAEHVFHLFLTFLHDTGSLDDSNLRPPVVRSAVRDTVAMLYNILTKAGAAPGPGNLMVTNSRSMVAVRIDEPMFVRRFNGINPKARNDHFRGVLVVSDPGEVPEGFEEIPQRSALTISRDLTTEITSLDS